MKWHLYKHFQPLQLHNKVFMLSLLLNYYEGFLKDEFENEECFVLFSASESILAVNEPTRTKF